MKTVQHGEIPTLQPSPIMHRIERVQCRYCRGWRNTTLETCPGCGAPLHTRPPFAHEIQAAKESAAKSTFIFPSAMGKTCGGFWPFTR